MNIRAWAAAMQRRVEAQFRRDWTFGFAVWNYLFRTAVNLQKNAYMFSAPDADGGGYHLLKPEEIVAGAAVDRAGAALSQFHFGARVTSRAPVLPPPGLSLREGSG